MNIPKKRQSDVMDVYWIILQTLESKVDTKKDILDKIQVEQAYDLLNDIGYTKHRPIWETKTS